jgi:hypothetical protein
MAGAIYFQEMSSASESGYAGAGMVARVLHSPWDT